MGAAMAVWSVCLVTGTALLWFINYDTFCIYLLSAAGKLNRLDEFERTVFPVHKYPYLQIGLAITTIGYLSATVLCWKYTSVIAQKLTYGVTTIQARKTYFIKSFTVREHCAVSICWLLLTGWSVYKCITLPISYDEAWTYLNFTSTNVFVSASYYPAPNNHILFSLLTNFSALLPLPPKVAVRFPNLLISIGSFWIVLYIFRALFRSGIAVFLTVSLYVSYPFSLYSTQGRGYLLYILFAGLSFYFMYTNRYKKSKNRWILFGLSSLLGLYTIPSFIYASASIGLCGALWFLCTKDWTGLLKFGITGILTGILTITAYIPVFLVNGLSAVTNNPFVEEKSFGYIREHIFAHLQGTANWFWGTLPVGYVLTLIVMTFSAFAAVRQQKYIFLAASIVICFLLPVVFIFLQSVIPFERTWSYLIFFQILALGTILEAFISNVKPMTLIAGTAVLIILGIPFFHSTYQKSYQIDFETKSIADYLLKQKYQRLFIQEDYQGVLLYYYFRTSGQAYQVDNGYLGAKLDETKKYHCLILSSHNLTVDPVGYQETYAGAFARVFSTIEY
jgi:hypothetical protein